MGGIAAFQHTSESAALATSVAETNLAGAVSLQVPGVQLGMEATYNRRCGEAAPGTREPGGQEDQEEDSGRAADRLYTAAEDNNPVPKVGVVADRAASAGDRALESPLLAESDVVGNKVLAVAGIVRVVACSEVVHGAYLGSREEARGVATSSCQAVEVAPVSENRKLCWRHWECAGY
jgi:hypothetical protein